MIKLQSMVGHEDNLVCTGPVKPSDSVILTLEETIDLHEVRGQYNMLRTGEGKGSVADI